MRKEVFRMERVTYKKHDNTILDDFNLNVFEGEIIGLLPINNYGINHFLDLLRTNNSIYDGYIYYNEKIINSWKMSDKNDNRITVIQDQSCLVDDLTVCDNIFVLRNGYKTEFINSHILKKQLDPFLKEIDIEILADAIVSKINVFERIIVEILKGIVAGHRLIVICEIETLITGEELSKLHKIIRFYAKKGYSFIYIASHFEEIVQICDRSAFYINGRIEKVLQEDEVYLENLTINTKDYDNLVRKHIEKREKKIYNSICEVNVKIENCEKNLNFKVYKGECLVVQCLHNEIYYKSIKTFIEGNMDENSYIKLENKRVNLINNNNFAIIQETPTQSMIFHTMSYMDNLCFNLDNRVKSVWINPRIKKSIRKEYTHILGKDVFDTPIENLTIKQKYQLVYTRILLKKPKVVFCIQPFKGADFELRMYIWKQLENFLDKGISVVIIAVNLADSLSIADRFIRIEDNENQVEYKSEQFSSIPMQAPWKYMYDNLNENN